MVFRRLNFPPDLCVISVETNNRPPFPTSPTLHMNLYFPPKYFLVFNTFLLSLNADSEDIGHGLRLDNSEGEIGHGLRLDDRSSENVNSVEMADEEELVGHGIKSNHAWRK